MKSPTATKLPRSTRLALFPTSRHMPGVWEDGERSLIPTGEYWTDDELLALGANTDVKYEIWDGKVIAMPPAGLKHGAIISQLMYLLGTAVYEHKLGRLFDGQTGFRLSFEHCFEPDISFVTRERLKLILTQAEDEKLFHGAPDLAVEVLSPSDSITKAERKIILYLTHGTRLAWMIDPKSKTVRVYRPGEDFELLRGDRFLTGNSVLPGLKVSLARIFEGI